MLLRQGVKRTTGLQIRFRRFRFCRPCVRPDPLHPSFGVIRETPPACVHDALWVRRRGSLNRSVLGHMWWPIVRGELVKSEVEIELKTLLHIFQLVLALLDLRSNFTVFHSSFCDYFDEIPG